MVSRLDEEGNATTAADIYVLGGGAVGAAVTRRLHEEGHAAALIDESHEASDIPIRSADPNDARVLDEVGLETASTVIAATASDSRNLLIAQRVKSQFDTDHIVVLVNKPGRVAAIADSGHEPVCATTVLGDALVTCL
jgi:trk system potassium uptake protein TrkA